MYGADFLNAANLFQRVGGWLALRSHGEEGDLSELLQRATYAHLNVLRMEALSEEIAHEFARAKGDLPIPDDKIVYWSPLMVQLASEVSACFGNLRRVQNLVLPLAYRAGGHTGGNPPKSLSDCMKRLDRLALPASIRTTARKYWTAGGRRVKDYRDVDLHHAAVVRHALFQLRPTETPFLTLPDNPEVNAPGQFSFNQGVNAIVYAPLAFGALHAFVEDVAADLGYPARPIDTQVGLGIMGPGQKGVDRTLFLSVGADGVATALQHLADGRAAVGRMQMAPPPAAQSDHAKSA